MQINFLINMDIFIADVKNGYIIMYNLKKESAGSKVGSYADRLALIVIALYGLKSSST